MLIMNQFSVYRRRLSARRKRERELMRCVCVEEGLGKKKKKPSDEF